MHSAYCDGTLACCAFFIFVGRAFIFGSVLFFGEGADL